MPLNTIYGPQGSGKNVFLAYIAKYEISSDIMIRANFTLNLNNWVPLQFLDLFDQLNNCAIFIDETMGWFNARRSGKDLNYMLGIVTSEARKADVDMYFTAQLPRMLDVYAREQNPNIVYCMKRCYQGCDRNCQACLKKPNQFAKYGRLDYVIEKQLLFSRRRVHKYIEGKEAVKLFSIFQTKEQVLPPDFDRLKTNVERQLSPAQIYDQAERYAHAVRPYLKKSGLKLSAVRAALNKLNIDGKLWGSDVYDALVLAL